MKKTAKRAARSLGLIEMGHLGEVALRVVAANLQAVAGIAVDILHKVEVPEEAFLMHRQQYDAGLIIQHLSGQRFSSHLKILAVTDVDICVPIFTHVYGEAEIGGRISVVSSYRLRTNEDGARVGRDRYYERLAKVSLHEVAHTFSVYHCDDEECLMHFSAKLEQLDRLSITFCRRCEFILRRNMKHVTVIKTGK